MLKDKDLIKLHKDKLYKKSNSWYKSANIKYTRKVIKEKASFISFSYSSTGNMSISVAITTLFWFLYKYYRITNDIIYCRSKIIENFLNSQFHISIENIISETVRCNGPWLEFVEEKLRIIEEACMDYLNVPENRQILSTYCRNKELFMSLLENTKKDIRFAFEFAINSIHEKEILQLSYKELIKTPSGIDMIRKISIKNANNGNLTNIE